MGKPARHQPYRPTGIVRRVREGGGVVNWQLGHLIRVRRGRWPTKPAALVRVGRSLIPSLIQLCAAAFTWALSALPAQAADGSDPR